MKQILTRGNEASPAEKRTLSTHLLLELLSSHRQKRRLHVNPLHDSSDAKQHSEVSTEDNDPPSLTLGGAVLSGRKRRLLALLLLPALDGTLSVQPHLLRF